MNLKSVQEFVHRPGIRAASALAAITIMGVASTAGWGWGSWGCPFNIINMIGMC